MMSTNIRYVPPNSQGLPSNPAPARPTPVNAAAQARGALQQQQSQQLPAGSSPTGRVQKHDIDAEMRAYMENLARGSTPVPGAMPQPKGKAARGRPPYQPPAIATSITYRSRGPSPKIVTRTEVWRPGGGGGGAGGGGGGGGGGVSSFANSPVDSPNKMGPSIFRPASTPQNYRASTPQQPLTRPMSRNASDPWNLQPVVPNRARSNSANSANSRESRRSSLDESQMMLESNGRVRSNTLERAASIHTDPRPFLRPPSTASTPPTPPAKDEYWRDFLKAPVNQSPRIDSVLLPPPRSAAMEHTPNTMQRPNNPNLRINVQPRPPSRDGARPSASQEKNWRDQLKKPGRKEPTKLENVLGIYPAENKLPPGRSAADEFVSKLATKFARKDKQESPTSPRAERRPPTEILQPIRYSPPGVPSEVQSPQKPFFQSPETTFMAELPGDLPDLVPQRRSGENDSIRSGSSGRSSGNSEPVEADGQLGPVEADGKPAKAQRAHRKQRPKGSEKLNATIPVGSLPNDRLYASRPLPAVPGAPPAHPPRTSSNNAPSRPAATNLQIQIPPSKEANAAAKFRMRGSFSPDTTYNDEITNWAESCFTKDQMAVRTPGPMSPEIVISPIMAVRRESVVDPNAPGMLVRDRTSKRPNTRFSGSRTLSLAPSEWEQRTSYASSMGDAFQYDVPDGTLKTIGEEPREMEEEEESLEQQKPDVDDAPDTPKNTHNPTESPLDRRSTTSSDSDDPFPLESPYDFSDAHATQLELEIEAILTDNTSNLTLSSLSQPTPTDSVYSIDYTPSTPGTTELDRQIDELLAADPPLASSTTTATIDTVSSATSDGFGLEKEYYERKTRYLAGRNSELDDDILFCLPSADLPPPRSAPLPERLQRAGGQG